MIGLSVVDLVVNNRCWRVDLGSRSGIRNRGGRISYFSSSVLVTVAVAVAVAAADSLVCPVFNVWFCAGGDMHNPCCGPFCRKERIFLEQRFVGETSCLFQEHLAHCAFDLRRFLLFLLLLLLSWFMLFGCKSQGGSSTNIGCGCRRSCLWVLSSRVIVRFGYSCFLFSFSRITCTGIHPAMVNCALALSLCHHFLGFWVEGCWLWVMPTHP